MTGWISKRLRQRCHTAYSLLPCFAAVCLFSVPGAATAVPLEDWQQTLMQSSGRVGEGLIEALSRQPSVRVLVSFEVRSPTRGGALTRFRSPEQRAALLEAGDGVLHSIRGSSFTTERRFAAINALAGHIDANGVLDLLDNPAVVSIERDLGGGATLTEAVPLTGVNSVRRQGFKGKGVTVAVLDSGIDATHRALKKARKAESCFCSGGGGCCPDGSSTQLGRGSAEDDEGHGTHVTGIIASRGRQSPRGVAPRSKIVAIKVLDENNRFCCSSDILAALDWIITERPDVDIINMSLSTDARFKGHCDRKRRASGPAFATAIDTLRDQGILVFASSGNEASKKMGVPACIANTTAVAATYDEEFGSADWGSCVDPDADPNHVTCFSNANKRTDLAAPGAMITSSRLGGGAVILAGTSMASPMAAGCAALLKQAFPDATPQQMEGALKSSSTIATHTRTGRGFPRLDCEESLAVLTEEMEP